MNHQGLLWNVHCVATVVLRKQLNLKARLQDRKDFVKHKVTYAAVIAEASNALRANSSTGSL